MRGWNMTQGLALYPNTSGAETNWGGAYWRPTATGFDLVNGATGAGETWLYIAIRRGPMKVPTVGTSVFAPLTRNTNGTNTNITTALTTVDMVMYGDRNGVFGTNAVIIDRLRSYTQFLKTSVTSLESYSSDAMTGFDVQKGYGLGVDISGIGTNYVGGYPVINWQFGRAPSFFDEVCYTGTGANTTQTHNLTVIPELMIVKRRSAANSWAVYPGPLANGTYFLKLDAIDAVGAAATVWNSTAPTASVFSIGTDSSVNTSASTYVAYLFATCAGVSKVGTYTGTAALLTVNCGFTAGARFVMIKRTDSTGSWYVWDSARGISSSTDPYLLFNSTAAEVTGTNYVDTDTSGFKVTAAAPAELNASAGTYLFLAIA
jgi:hypothetical protein